MQNRKFDIAGPNPTPEEQKHIDEQYTAYLDNQRRSSIAAAFAAKQLQLQRASLKTEGERAPLATGSTGKPPRAAASDTKRMKAADCAGNTLSCEWWPKLSEGIKDLKKALFGPSSSKAKRS
jgi:CRISPR/Cas system-associated endonuclease Cas1